MIYESRGLVTYKTKREIEKVISPPKNVIPKVAPPPTQRILREKTCVQLWLRRKLRLEGSSTGNEI